MSSPSLNKVESSEELKFGYKIPYSDGSEKEYFKELGFVSDSNNTDGNFIDIQLLPYAWSPDCV